MREPFGALLGTDRVVRDVQQGRPGSEAAGDLVAFRTQEIVGRHVLPEREDGRLDTVGTQPGEPSAHRSAGLRGMPGEP
ncbi:hypothetical protein ACFXKD_00285 [Nocardiopsis aegyptia]|uniref:hypothetical protein n=1 Tax=Nocardiopsis aegyptia TaxID=220378 RepID=UPI0036721142